MPTAETATQTDIRESMIVARTLDVHTHHPYLVNAVLENLTGQRGDTSVASVAEKVRAVYHAGQTEQLIKNLFTNEKGERRDQSLDDEAAHEEYDRR